MHPYDRSHNIRVNDRFPPIRGYLALCFFRLGRCYSAGKPNLVLTEARRLVPQLLAGEVSAPDFSIGIGTNPRLPSVADTALDDPFKKQVATIEVGETTITFRFYIAPNEAVGVPVQEYGLFANDRLIARTVRSLVTKAPDMNLSGGWTLQI